MKKLEGRFWCTKGEENEMREVGKKVEVHSRTEVCTDGSTDALKPRLARARQEELTALVAMVDE